MIMLHQIREFAFQAHGDQQRKYEKGHYIQHLDRVKDICTAYSTDPHLYAVAYLHDVLEDTAVKRNQLLDFLCRVSDDHSAGWILQRVIELTDVFTKQNYPQWNRRKRKAKEAERLSRTSAEAQTVKYADILDNSRSILHAADDFALVYLSESRMILKGMTCGHPRLYELAVSTVDEHLKKLKEGLAGS